MRISQADVGDVAGLARLVWLHASDEEQARQSVDAFEADLRRWWGDHCESHVAFVARLQEAEIVGVAWVALLARVPRPGAMSRLSADIQSVFVLPDHRGQGVGSALVQAAADHATSLGASRVTVHSSSRAVTVYERLGFASSSQLLQRRSV